LLHLPSPFLLSHLQEVVNVDISPVVVDQMRLQHPDLGQRWEAADCRAMPQYDDGYYGAVVDKGTLDAVLCCHTGQADGAAYINEVHRLLAPGGMFLLISLGQPRARLPLLHVAVQGGPGGYLSGSSSACSSPTLGMMSGRGSMDAQLNGSARSAWEWGKVEVYLLPKPSVYLATEASLLGKSVSASAPQHNKDEPISWLGPYAPEDVEEQAAAQQLALHEYFFAYACTKASS
jgi:SAM-dependent methyltransferase